MKVIKYFEDNEWKYATVKGLGDTDQLLTSTKTSLVDAINELVTNGISGGTGTGTGGTGTGGTGTGTGDDTWDDAWDGTGTITVQDLPKELIDKINSLQSIANNLSTSQTGLSESLIATQGSVSTLDEKAKKLDGELKSLNLKVGTFTQEDYNSMMEDIRNSVNALSNEMQANYSEFDERMENEATNTQNKLNEKLSLTQYQNEQESISESLASKVDKSEYNEFVEETNTSVTNINNTLTSKVDSVYFNKQFGLNAWECKTYIDSTITKDMLLDFNSINDDFLTDTNEVEDGDTLILENNSNQLSNVSTNVYLNEAKNVTLKCSYFDSLTVYVNGAIIHQSTNSDGSIKDAVISFKKGWNTINLLHYQSSEKGGLLVLGVVLNELVERMSYIASLNDTYKLEKMSTEIQQNKESINLSATHIADIEGNISDHETKIQENAEAIKLSAKKTELDAVTQRMTDAEASIQLNADNIESKVSKTDYDILNGKVSEHDTKITQLSDSIELVVSNSDVEAFGERLTTAENKIKLNSDNILLSAKQTDVDNISNRVTDAESAIQVNSDNIALKASKKDVDSLSGRMSNAESAIKLNSDNIALTAKKTDLDTLTERLTEAESSITINTDSITQKVDQTTFDSLTGRVKTAESKIEANTNGIELKYSELKDDVTSLDSRISITEKGIMSEVEKNGLLSIVTQTEDKWQVDASKIVLNGETLITDAKINSAFIKNLDASVITSGTIDASKINVINLSANQILANGISADKITGGTLKGVTLDITDGTSSTSGFHVASDGSIKIGNYFSVDKYGNLNAISGTFKGTLSGATGTFSGELSGAVISGGTISGAEIKGGNIEVDSTVYIGDNLYIGNVDESGIYLVNKSIWFNNESFIKYHKTSTSNPNLQINSTGDINITCEDSINLMSTTVNLDGNVYASVLYEGSNRVATQSWVTGKSYATKSWVTGKGYLTSMPSSIDADQLSCNELFLGVSLAYTSGYLTAPKGTLSISQNTVVAKTIKTSGGTTLSNAELKKNIQDWEYEALPMILSTPIRQYQYKDELDEEFPHVGIIVQEAPVWVVSLDGDGVEPYKMSALAWKAIQEEDKKVKELEDENKELKERLENIESILKANGLM